MPHPLSDVDGYIEKYQFPMNSFIHNNFTLILSCFTGRRELENMERNDIEKYGEICESLDEGCPRGERLELFEYCQNKHQDLGWTYETFCLEMIRWTLNFCSYMNEI